MTDLSPAAEAVLDAFFNGFLENPDSGMTFMADRNGLAAALRAAADQVVPALDPDDPGPVLIDAERNRTLRQLLAIADELEALPDD